MDYFKKLKRLNTEDTIAAISTPIGEGGIGIVRLSGPEAISIAGRVFHGKDKNPLESHPTFTVHYGHIVNPHNGHEIVDEVLITVMRAPRTYTKEDIVEINCHGGIVPLRKVLDLVISEGARMAEPGEFTRRAFLNGRIDLSQAEAVLDIIRSKTEASLKAAVNQLEGRLSMEIREIRENVLSVLVEIEAGLDFPDEELETAEDNLLIERVNNASERLKRLLVTAEAGIILRQGITTVLCGRPNVGKSSLMNALLRQERVIVTPVPGTTRDTVEEAANIMGIALRIVDTAGISESQDPVQREGIKRSRRSIETADLVLLVIDGSEPLTESDRSLLSLLQDKKYLIVVNKSDLPWKIDLSSLRMFTGNRPVLTVSATQPYGIETLEATIINMVWHGKIEISSNVLLTNLRQVDAVRKASRSLECVLQSLKENISSELIAVDLREALDDLGEITGETITDDLLDRIFSQFCIGK